MKRMIYKMVKIEYTISMKLTMTFCILAVIKNMKICTNVWFIVNKWMHYKIVINVYCLYKFRHTFNSGESK